MTDFYALSKEVQRIAETELFEVPSRVKEDIAHIRSWLSKQSHINARTDDYTLLMFLRSCKFSLEKTKKRLELFYKAKSSFPEIFSNRDPFQDKIYNMLSQGMIAVLPETADGPVVLVLRMEDVNPDIVSVNDILKVAFVAGDVIMRVSQNFSVVGQSIVVDYNNMSLKYLMQATPVFLKKVVLCIESAYPSRLKTCCAINLHPAFTSAYNILKSFLSKKLQTRIFCYAQGESHNLQRHFPLTILPNEYGGTAGSFAELSQNLQKTIESYSNWIIEDEQYRSIEEKNPASSDLNLDFFSLDGSFRKLEID